jgi:PTH1 family peptidyl-tRNA hydrolase
MGQEEFREKAVLLKPMTYMNLSGESIREALAYFKIPPRPDRSL